MEIWSFENQQIKQELKNPELEDLLQDANSQILELKQANGILSENLQGRVKFSNSSFKR